MTWCLRSLFWQSLFLGVLNGPFPASFFFIFVFAIQLIVHEKFANDCIKTADLWCPKWPIYQLRHNHCPFAIKSCTRLMTTQPLYGKSVYDLAKKIATSLNQNVWLPKFNHVIFLFLMGYSRPFYSFYFRLHNIVQTTVNKCSKY